MYPSLESSCFLSVHRPTPIACYEHHPIRLWCYRFQGLVFQQPLSSAQGNHHLKLFPCWLHGRHHRQSTQASWQGKFLLLRVFQPVYWWAYQLFHQHRILQCWVLQVYWEWCVKIWCWLGELLYCTELNIFAEKIKVSLNDTFAKTTNRICKM